MKTKKRPKESAVAPAKRDRTNGSKLAGGPSAKPPDPASQKSQRPQDALLAMLLEQRPPDGEDFHVFSIVRDADQPIWEKRLSFAGTYEKAAALCVRALGALADSGGLAKGARIELFQGDAARAYLAASLLQEAKYRQERAGVQNN